MKFNLNGTEYYTEHITHEYEEIRRIDENGKVLHCVFGGLGSFPTMKDIKEYLELKGAKVVEQ